MKKQRVYSQEVKRSAVTRVARGESVTKVARDLKIERQRLYEWHDKYREEGEEALRGVGRPRKAAARSWRAGEDELATAKRRVAELERKIGQQQVDLDFFRKALRLVEETRRVPGERGAAASTKSSKR